MGIAVALVAYAVYSASDALVKGLGQSLGPFEIGFAIALFSLLPGLLGKPKAERWRDTFRLANPVWVHTIAVLRMASNVLAVYAFISVPLADAYCIIFMMPVFIAILSVVVLREHVPVSRWVLVGVSFVGVLLVVRPGFRELQLGHLAALGFALTAAGALVITRMVAAEERRMSLFALPLLYTAGFNGLMLLGGFVMPDPITLLVLVACGLTGGAGYLFAGGGAVDGASEPGGADPVQPDPLGPAAGDAVLRRSARRAGACGHERRGRSRARQRGDRRPEGACRRTVWRVPGQDGHRRPNQRRRAGARRRLGCQIIKAQRGWRQWRHRPCCHPGRRPGPCRDGRHRPARQARPSRA